MEKTINKKKNKKIFKYAIISAGSIIIVWSLTLFLLPIDLQKRGTFGDMFGAVNALFSGPAFGGIIFTIFLQSKELKIQRKELKDTRKEFKTQNETLKIQRFENTFFNLLSIHHQIVNSIVYNYEDIKYYGNTHDLFGISPDKEPKEITINLKGRELFKYRYKEMQQYMEDFPEKYSENYLNQYHQSQAYFGHYFRNLYRMIKLVDQTDFFYNSRNTPIEEVYKMKYKYTSMIRAQISDYELLMLFYNCLTELGNEKFKPLIENYTFFKNLPKDLIYSKDHLILYANSAFEKLKQ
jgi:hypothetical protein